MKIAFDSTVVHGHKSGVGYYCSELLNAMLDIDHINQFYVFSHKRLPPDFHSSRRNLQISNSKLFPIRAFYLHALLPRILDEIQPDLCHYTNFLAPIFEERPYVVTIHDMGLEVLRHSHPLAKRIYTKRLVPWIARKARLILTNSEYSKFEIARHLGISEDRIRITPLAASPEFVPSPHPVETPYFLYVGNIEPRKNLECLLEAFARMPLKDHQLVIAGNGLYRARAVKEKARSLGLNSRVKFLGYIDRSKLPPLYSGATAFVYPSLLEGFGMPIVEAMACGTPVITSDNSSLAEIGHGAAILVDPRDPRVLAEAMVRAAEDESLRRELSRKGLRRASEFSWTKTAELTLDAYQEALDAQRSSKSTRQRSESIVEAIHRTNEYAALFQYPLRPEELRERLFDVRVDEETFRRIFKRLRLPVNPDWLRLREAREKLTELAVRDVQPHLRTLVSLPFVRMVAFSGATAHKNMTGPEDIDLFMIVEDGKLWAVFLIAMVWAKMAGLRKRLCMNYLISDAALVLSEQDTFTAQQAASLKPFYGKTSYDRFIERNTFIRERFPNFTPSTHREMYPEVKPKRFKSLLEGLLCFGPIQVLEQLSRVALGRYLRGKAREAAHNGEPDVRLTRRRLKLHLRSHRQDLLIEMAKQKESAAETSVLM